MNSRTVDVVVIGGGVTGAGVLRDLARRGLKSLLVERGDYGTGASGRYHGLLHSGARYVVDDAAAARECISENRILHRIAPASIESTGGYFVATPADPEDYVAGFPAACHAAGVDCEEIPVAVALRHEPALNPRIRRVFKVPDGSVESWQLIESNVADARAHGSDAWVYQRLVAMNRVGERIDSIELRDERSGSLTRIAPRLVVNCAGAWAGDVAAMLGLTVRMRLSKGSMLVYNQRMTDTVISRCHAPGDGDAVVPVHTVAILGATAQDVEDPDRYEITRHEVAALIREGEMLFPGLGKMRLLRAYAGVRPLYDPPAEISAATKGGRQLSRTHIVLDHGATDGVENFVTVVGGKLTTFRKMAEDTVDVACEKLGFTAACTTAEEILPNQVPGKTYWLGHRLADHEAMGGGDAELLCECELVTRPMLTDFLERHPGCSLDDVRRGTRLGMGPCQGGFCTFRAAGVLGQRAGQAGATDVAELVDRAILGFLRERFKGTRPIAVGRQLQEQWMISGVYEGVLGVESLIQPEKREDSAKAIRG